MLKVSIKNKKILVVSLILLLSTIGFLFLWRNTNKEESVQLPTDTAAQTNEQKGKEDAINADKKKQTIEQDSSSPSGGLTSNSSLSLSAKTETNGTVTVFTRLPAVPNGTCNLSVLNGTKTYSQEAEVIYQPEYSSCAGFSVPVSNLGQGNWNIKLSVTSNGNTVINSINYEVK